MLNILICEDDPVEALQLETCLRASRTLHGIDLNIETFGSARQTLLNFDPADIDILFLDIIMQPAQTAASVAVRKAATGALASGPTNGIELARVIRERDADVPIVFVTSSRDYAVESYDVQATHYLIKPITTKAIDVALARCQKVIEDKRRYVTVFSGHSSERVFVRDIIWAESLEGHTRIHLARSNVDSSITLAALQEQGGPSLLRCHRSFLVNMDHVERNRGRTFTMDSGDQVPIRTNGATQVVEAYRNYLFEHTRS